MYTVHGCVGPCTTRSVHLCVFRVHMFFHSHALGVIVHVSRKVTLMYSSSFHS